MLRGMFAVASLVLFTIGCGGNLSNAVCAPDQLVGQSSDVVRACYGEPLDVEICKTSLCGNGEERWFYRDPWSTSDVPPFACVAVNDGIVTRFIYDSVICEIGFMNPGT